MTYKIKKSKGRPKVAYKIRCVDGITPKGFVFKEYSRKKRALIYKRVD